MKRRTQFVHCTGVVDFLKPEVRGCRFWPLNPTRDDLRRSMNGTCTTCGGSNCVCSTAETLRALEEKLALAEARERALRAMINAPELEQFLRAVHIEAVHQVERWGTDHDQAKRPADWFWLVGYLAGKALHAAIAGDRDKARHHCISTAAALYNWHCAIAGIDVRMCPGRSDIAAHIETRS